MGEATTKVLHADFDQIRNDLFWKVFKDGEFIRWTGYDDHYWWQNVAKSPEHMTRTDSKGRKWLLSPRTCVVTEVVCP